MSKDITKQHITDSFNALFRKYPLEKITVNMIIENAGVSKSTFYRYFLDKFDVMNYIRGYWTKFLRTMPAKAGRICSTAFYPTSTTI